MAAYTDHAFLFTSETDLLPIWFAYDQHFPSEILAENLWDDDTFASYSNFLPQQHCSENEYEVNNASLGCALDFQMSSHAVNNQDEDTTLFRNDSTELVAPLYTMTTEGREVVWEIPSIPAMDFSGSYHEEKRELILVHNQETSFYGGESSEDCVKDVEASLSDVKNLSDEDEEINAENDEEREALALDVIDDMNCGEMCDPGDFKLPASKSPIMEAMVVCAIKNWGLVLHKSSPNQVVFRVTDFERYYKISRAICSKQHPTEDIGSRVKSLRRWFDNFPKKKDRQDNPNFLLAVKSSGTKKVNEMIERNTRLLGVQKRRRRQ